MIIKILSSAKNFSGVNYNEKKNDLGESELLCAENFGGLSFQSDLSRVDYVNYMKAIGSLNPRVKNKQFHAVISVKGKQGNLDQLVDAGKVYLDKMGYGQNPYLIYHHADTANTHIHIISTRVDKNGLKVDDSFERLRSQKVMHEILSRDPLYEADHSIKQALTYQLSTEAQFRLLLELQGFTLRDKSGMLEVIKYGEVQRILDDTVIANRIAAYQFDNKRAQQLKAIFSKYAIGLSEEQWINLAKEKFGIDLVFHRKNEVNPPYGYTIVDHSSKNVFKGSQVLKLSAMYAMASEAKVKAIVNDLCAQPGISFAQLQRKLSSLDLSVSSGGSINRGHKIWDLPASLLKSLKYADRLEIAAAFKVNSRDCIPVLGKLLMVKPAAISITQSSNVFEGLQVLLNYLNEQHKWKEGLKHYDLKILQYKDQVYLLSLKDQQLVSLKELLVSPLTMDAGMIPELEQMDLSQAMKSPQDNLLSVLADLLPEMQGNKEDRHRKRKQHQINN